MALGARTALNDQISGIRTCVGFGQPVMRRVRSTMLPQSRGRRVANSGATRDPRLCVTRHSPTAAARVRFQSAARVVQKSAARCRGRPQPNRATPFVLPDKAVDVVKCSVSRGGASSGTPVKRSDRRHDRCDELTADLRLEAHALCSKSNIPLRLTGLTVSSLSSSNLQDTPLVFATSSPIPLRRSASLQRLILLHALAVS